MWCSAHQALGNPTSLEIFGNTGLHPYYLHSLPKKKMGRERYVQENVCIAGEHSMSSMSLLCTRIQVRCLSPPPFLSAFLLAFTCVHNGLRSASTTREKVKHQLRIQFFVQREGGGHVGEERERKKKNAAKTRSLKQLSGGHNNPGACSSLSTANVAVWRARCGRDGR